MKRILTIAGLTWKAAFRYKFFWVLAALLAAAVVLLPIVLKDDGTAKGLTQILITYTLSCVAGLLGMSTLWLSCGTLAKDVEECQMQMVVVKPISRWQVWLGKWVGILALNAVLLALSGAGIYSLLLWRSHRLPPPQQEILRNEIFVARASMKERQRDWRPIIEKVLAQQIKEKHPQDEEIPELRKQITEEIKSIDTDVPPQSFRRWVMDMHTLPEKSKQAPVVLRVKFHTSNMDTEKTYDTIWRVGPTNSSNPAVLHEVLPPDSFQEIRVPAGCLDERGHLVVDLFNPNDLALVFPVEDGMELLYYENTFGINFVRGIAVIFCWLALLATIGLAMASYLSFPVAAFASVAVLLMGLSSGEIQTVVDQGTIVGYDSQRGGFGHSPLDIIVVPVFAGALKIIKLVEAFSPVDFLSEGRSITWGMLGLAVTQIILILGGFFVALGILLFARRELATAQGNL